MARQHALSYALNAGGVDPDAIARVDLEKMRIAGEHPVSNVLPRTLGPMTLRPGSESLVRIPSDAQTRQIRFLRSIGTSYILLMAPGEMRVSLDGAITQVPAVSTVINPASWSDQSTAPAAISVTLGVITMTATPTSFARARQSVSVASGDRTLVNILRIVVGSGPIVFRVGSTAGGKDIVNDTTLDTGTHKIGFTPGSGVGTIYIEFQSEDDVPRIVTSCQFEANVLGGAGDLVLPTPWAAWSDIEALRTDQSIDVLYCGDGVHQQRKIEHRGPYAWSVVEYKSANGPWIYGSDRVGMSASARTGSVTITATEPTFKSTHVGALIEMTSKGKTVSLPFNAEGQVTDYISVVGVEARSERIFNYEVAVSGWTGSVVLERSLDVPDPLVWSEYNGVIATGAVGSTPSSDGPDNAVAHYRWRCKTYTAGTATVSLTYVGGSQVGRARITGYTSPTQVTAEVIEPFGNTGKTRDWRIGDWSEERGWPRTPILHDGRLHWFRKDVHFGSTVDDYTNFDDSQEGDSEPFTRSVGAGGEDGVLWALSQDKLIAGTSSFEAVITASELDEPLTPTRYTVRKPSRRGCADVAPAEHDRGAFFVQRSTRRLYEISLPDGSSKFASQDVSRLNPAAYRAGIAAPLAVQQQPDTRCYAVLDTGSVSVLTFDRDDRVAAITTIDIAGGLVEDVCVLPGIEQDDVYMIVNRSGQRYQERLAPEAEQSSVSTCALLDGHKVLTGSISSITGASQFASQTVQVWADGQRRADVALNGSGVGALGATYSRVVYGKKYTATFKSTKLEHAAKLGTATSQTKQIHGVGLVLANSCLDGITVGQYGYDSTPLPVIINGAARTDNQFFTSFDEDVFPILGNWTPDARFVLTIDSAEGPVTVQAISIDVETRDGAQE